MKILLCSSTHHNNLFNFEEVFLELGMEVCYLGMDEFDHKYNYWARKINKLGIREIKKKYYEDWNSEFINIYDKFRPDIVLFINGCEIINEHTLKYLKAKTKLAVWFIDGIKRDLLKKLEHQFKYYDFIFTFEQEDLSEIKRIYGVEAYFCPIGYNNFIYYPVDSEKDIDIIFVGVGSERRIKILNEVAKFAQKENLIFKIVGEYYSKVHFWKKWQFKQRYPFLYNNIKNEFIPPRKVVELYRRSKICINIHVEEHAGLNPRSFDILGAKSFMLVDERKNYSKELQEGRDFITYKDISDLIIKIKYYLYNEDERAKIANSGYNSINKKMKMIDLLDKYMFNVFKECN